MTQCQLQRRLARLRSQERGFTIIETMVAVTIMFSMLVALAWVVVQGFQYMRIGRVRQTGTAIANQIMEQARGLAYDKISAGMLTTDVSTSDANIVNCSGTYMLFACTASGTSTPGTAEPLVSSAGLSNASPIVPHQSSTSPNSSPTIDGETYTWSTYVTRAASPTNSPYRVTVQVNWPSTIHSSASYVRIQSYFWSPIGCRGTSTHPYAAPCQPFFFGEVTVPQGAITIAPTTVGGVGLANSVFEQAVISLPAANASIEQEQVVQSLAEFDRAEANITTDGTISSIGGQKGSSTADSDPGSTQGSYQRVRCGTELTCGSYSASSPDTSSQNRLTVSLPSSTTAESDAAVSASGTSVCPPSNIQATAESDNLACAAASTAPSGVISAAINLGNTSAGNLGSWNLVNVAVPGSSNPASIRTFANRVTNPSTAGCSPGSGTDGCLALSATRSYGDVGIGGLPGSCFTAPTGWTGYFTTITGYSDSVTAAVGTGAPLAATSSSPPSGSLSYYDPLKAGGAGYSTLPLNGSLAGVTKSATITTNNVGQCGNKTVVATITIDGTQNQNVIATASTTPSAGVSATRTAVTATITAPVIVVCYQLQVAGVTQIDLTTTVALGALDADASYAVKPSQGS